MIEQFRLGEYLSFQNADVSFDKGLVVFTGPSGSGKSIFVDAMLGSFGLKKPLASMSESVVDHVVDVENYGLDSDDVLIFKQIKKEKLRFFLNGQSMAKQTVNEVASKFIRHLSLKDYSDFEQSNLLHLVDQYVEEGTHLEIVDAYTTLFRTLKEKEKALSDVLAKQKEQVELREFAQFEVDKIDAIDPTADEYEELLEVKRKLSKKERIEESISKAEAIFEVESVVFNALDELAIDSGFLDDALNQLRSVLEDGQDSLRELDDLDIEEVLDRIEQLSELKRRYGSIEEALAYRDQKREELQFFDTIDESLHELESEVSELSQQVETEAKTITKARKGTLKRINSALSELATSLYLSSVQLDLEAIERHTLGADEVTLKIGGAGLDKISSGEFNRLRLALLALRSQKSVQEDGVLFLDEIDANLSGEESMSVANVLRTLSKNYQIFSISHQPQLTSKADQHFMITKDQYSSIRQLGEEERIDEIARMISGDKITNEAVEFAKRLRSEA
jgi:DNA repair protein RecN (Recombination protein N)